MSCPPFELKDYFLGELGVAERGQVESHIRECRSCREELDRLRLTEAALHVLHEEEPPRRIAFVSDKVFEPRWWQVWLSPARLGFASAALLSIAILVHAFSRPAAVIPVAPAVDTAAIEARVSAEVAKRLAESEARQAKKAGEMVEAVRRDLEFQRRADRVAFEEAFTILQKKYNNVIVASNDLGGARP